MAFVVDSLGGQDKGATNAKINETSKDSLMNVSLDFIFDSN